MQKVKVILGERLRTEGRHDIYASNIGEIRKSLSNPVTNRHFREPVESSLTKLEALNAQIA